tara:strand:- start:7861 stop:9129 length:1269 start_codon:yes stop_codon:yes gene_type:complete
MKRSLAVIDPALGPTLGHHAGFAEAIADMDHQGRQIDIWCHTLHADSITARLTVAGITSHPEFSINWYQWHDQQPPVAARAQHINQLAREYLSVFSKIRTTGPTIYMHHSLDWLNACALFIALEQQRQQQTDDSESVHCVLLMFAPGFEHSPTEPHRQLNYSLGFRQLLQHPQVRAFASCSEYRDQYQRLLTTFSAPTDRPKIGLHPCFLADWAQWPAANPAPSGDNQPPRQILLFLGDPREDKGFLDLPAITTALLARWHDNVPTLVIQHSLPQDWAEPEIHQAAIELKRLADAHPQINLTQGYWPSPKLQQAICESDWVVFNYPNTSTMDKSSGVLWLAAQQHKLIVAPQTSWVWREALRLGCSVADIQTLLRPDKWQPSVANSNTTTSRYRQQIYTPFLEWLDTELSLNPTQTLMEQSA